MTGKVNVGIERDAESRYAWCPELKGCRPKGRSVEAALIHIREAIELFLETLPEEERSAAPSREILTTAVGMHA